MRLKSVLGSCLMAGLLLPTPAAADQGRPNPVDTKCKRTGLRGDVLARELTRLIANAHCAINGASLAPLAPQCPWGWRLQQTRALPGPWWAGSPANSVPTWLQDSMIMQARSQARSSPAPTGMQLLRVLFTDQCTEAPGGGMGAICRISAVAEFGTCR